MKNPRGEGITVNQQSANDPSGSVLSVSPWQIPPSANDPSGSVPSVSPWQIPPSPRSVSPLSRIIACTSYVPEEFPAHGLNRNRSSIQLGAAPPPRSARSSLDRHF